MGDVLSQIISEEHSTLLTQEICNLKYEEFLVLLKDLNIIAKRCMESKDYQLIFAVMKDTTATVFWKATVQIACVKVDPKHQVLSYRLLTLSQFLKVFRTLKCQLMAEEQSKCQHSNHHLGNVTFSTLFDDSSQHLATEAFDECIICFERKQEVTLPCAHSFCNHCIEEWNATNDTCPICRERLESPNDTWVISEAPKPEEIYNEIRENLLELSEDKHSCNPS